MALADLDSWAHAADEEAAKCNDTAANEKPKSASPARPTNKRNKVIVLYLVAFMCVCLVAGGVALFQRSSWFPANKAVNEDNETTTALVSVGPVTLAPSNVPSWQPSDSPSTVPTTVNIFVEPNPIPVSPAKAYFNYDSSDRSFGPNQWRRADMRGTYYQEFGANGFGVWKGHLRFHVSDPQRNRCGVQAKQSPIRLQRTKGSRGVCTATHQIRTRTGVHRLQSKAIEKRIESNKLRLVLPRRQCLNPKNQECFSNRPPSADFPKYSSDETHYSDLLNLDIKIPAEHVLLNETFDAEIQMLHLHITASRMAHVGVLVRAVEDAHNEEFQAILDEFQLTYDRNVAACEKHRGNQAVGTNVVLPEDADGDPTERRLQTATTTMSSRFDPYNDLMPTVFFYRYEGSSTEPPCMSMTWFVMTQPLIIGTAQLRQIQRLLFTNVDETCQPTSAHNLQQSVARPLQPLGKIQSEERAVMLCKEGSFLPDN